MSKLCELSQIKPYEDKRGLLKKILMKSHMQDFSEVEEIYLIYFNHNSIRGNHYHQRTFEHFTVVSGRVKVALQDLFQKIQEEFYLDADDNVILRVPPNIIHAFKNEEKHPLIMLAVSSREYSTIDSDTFNRDIL